MTTTAKKTTTKPTKCDGCGRVRGHAENCPNEPKPCDECGFAPPGHAEDCSKREAPEEARQYEVAIKIDDKSFAAIVTVSNSGYAVQVPGIGTVFGDDEHGALVKAEALIREHVETAAKGPMRATVDGKDALILSGTTGAPIIPPAKASLDQAMQTVVAARASYNEAAAAAAEASQIKGDAQKALNAAVDSLCAVYNGENDGQMVLGETADE